MRTMIIAAVFALSACAHIGHEFNPDDVRQFKPGVTTKQDAITKLGAPAAESDMGNGQELLQWNYIQGTLFGASSAHAAVLFGPDNKMIRVSMLSQQ